MRLGCAYYLLAAGLFVSFTNIVFEVIDMRSFSNLWFWIGLAVLWSWTSHYVLGVPYDLITRARREGLDGDLTEDMVDLARIHVMRLLRFQDISGLWIAGFMSFAFTSLAVLGFYYGIEFAQALLCLGAPFALTRWLALRAAHQIRMEDPTPERLVQILMNHRVHVQIIGMAAIFVTSLWGMYVNITLPGWYQDF